MWTTDEWTVGIKVVKSFIAVFQQKSDFRDYTEYSKQTTPCSLRRVWNLQLCVMAITFFLPLFSLTFFFTRTGRSNHRWKQDYQCWWNCYCCFIPEKTIVTVLDFRNAKQQFDKWNAWLIASLQIFKLCKNQSFVSKYTYTAQSNNNLVNLLLRKLACAGS